MKKPYFKRDIQMTTVIYKNIIYFLLSTLVLNIILQYYAVSFLDEITKVSIIYIIIVLGLIFFFFFYFIKNNFLIKINVYNNLLFLFFLMLCVSFIIHKDYLYELLVIEKFIVFGLLPSFLLTNIINSKRDFNLFLNYLWLVSTIFTTLVLFEYLRGNIIPYLYNRLSLKDINPIWFSVMGGLTVLINLQFIYLWKFHKSSKLKLLSNIYNVIIGLFIMIISASRGPLLALVITMLFLLFLKIEFKKIGFASIVIFLFGIIAYKIFPDSFQRLTELSSQSHNINERMFMWEKSFGVMDIKSLFVGLGYQKFGEFFNLEYPHNIVIELITVKGFPVFLIFLTILIYTLICAVMVILKSNYIFIPSLFIYFFITSLFSHDLGTNSILFTLMSINTKIFFIDYFPRYKGLESIEEKESVRIL